MTACSTFWSYTICKAVWQQGIFRDRTLQENSGARWEEDCGYATRRIFRGYYGTSDLPLTSFRTFVLHSRDENSVRWPNKDTWVSNSSSFETTLDVSWSWSRNGTIARVSSPLCFFFSFFHALCTHASHGQIIYARNPSRCEFRNVSRDRSTIPLRNGSRAFLPRLWRSNRAFDPSIIATTTKLDISN